MVGKSSGLCPVVSSQQKQDEWEGWKGGRGENGKREDGRRERRQCPVGRRWLVKAMVSGKDGREKSSGNGERGKGWRRE